MEFELRGPDLPNLKTSAVNHYLFCPLLHVEPSKPLWVFGAWSLLYMQNKGVGLGFPRSL